MDNIDKTELENPLPHTLLIDFILAWSENGILIIKLDWKLQFVESMTLSMPIRDGIKSNL